MLQFTEAQATLIAAALALGGGLIAWFGRGLAFVVSRWWTGTPKRERADYLNSVADLAGKLRTSGMTIEEVHAFEAVMRSPTVAASPSATMLVDAMNDEASEPHEYTTNFAMKARAGAAYDVADAQLNQALMDLRLLLSQSEENALMVAHKKWCDYRKALEVLAGLEFEGGTHAPLAGLMTGLVETERRIAEVRARIAARSAE